MPAIMNARFPLLLAAAAAFSMPALAQSGPPALAAPAARAPAPVDDLVKVALDTDAGRIVVALDRGRAPVTTANFLRYVDSGKFNGESFYRAMRYGQGGLIQGGITSNARKLGPPIAHEPTSATGLRNVAGTLAMARLAPGSARADFFILTTDIPAFDASGSDPGFAAFGRVVEGMEVVNRILAAPVSATRGEGAMKGQMLEPRVTIRKAARVAK